MVVSLWLIIQRNQASIIDTLASGLLARHSRLVNSPVDSHRFQVLPMGKKNSGTLHSSIKISLQLLGVMVGMFMSWSAQATDLPLAASSPLSGITFEDRPLALPVQRNFQMAMLTASSELGRSCSRMEAYGWRMAQSEQARANQIFNDAVDSLQGLGYTVEAQAPTSVSHDITMFTADRADHHFITMWSAGELGLVMVLCEASPPYHYRNATSSKPSVQVFQPPQDILQSKLEAPRGKVRNHSVANFSPVGDWVGGYTCEQGYTGGTLQIAHLNGENFDGFFRFYPTPKNPYALSGRYAVFGQYDRASQRILINPGKWLQRPKNYYNTIMVGSFDPITRTFSAYFQGINGCTSFEAQAASEDYVGRDTAEKKKPKKKKAKKAAKKKITSAPVTDTGSVLSAPVAPALPAGSATMPVPNAAPAALVAPASVAPAPPAPAASSVATPPTSAPTSAPAAPEAAPASIVLPAPEQPAAQPATAAPVSITPPAVAPPAPITPPPAQAPAPATAPAAAPADPTTPKPSGAFEPRHKEKLIQLAASGQWFTPTSPQAPTASYITPTVPQVPAATMVAPAQIAPEATRFQPVVPTISPAPTAQPAQIYNTNVSQVPTAPIAPTSQTAPEANRFIPTVPQVPQAEIVPDNGGSPRP